MAVLRNYGHTPAYITPLFSKQEVLKLNQLVGSALTSRSIRQRLIVQGDATLQREFDLAPETWQYIASIRVASLEEFCQAVLHLQAEVRAS